MFIDEHRGSYGVEPICAVLPIAPSTYYAHKTMQANPTLRSVRAQRDELLKPEIRRVWMQNFQVYGAKKVWKQLNREGITVARCTVARLMKDLELCGVTRRQRFRVTRYFTPASSYACRSASHQYALSPNSTRSWPCINSGN